jgi:hypothetical protein
MVLKDFRKYLPIALGLLFLYSGFYKALYPGAATHALRALDIPRSIANATIVGVTTLEIYLGIILLFRKDLKYGLMLATGLVFAFTVFLWYLSTLAHPPSCGCMALTGIFKSNKQNAVFGVFRNCVILYLLKLSYDYYVKPSSLEHPSAALGATG